MLAIKGYRLRVDGRTAAGTYHVGDRQRFEKSIGGMKAQLTERPFSAPPPAPPRRRPTVARYLSRSCRKALSQFSRWYVRAILPSRMV